MKFDRKIKQIETELDSIRRAKQGICVITRRFNETSSEAWERQRPGEDPESYEVVVNLIKFNAEDFEPPIKQQAPAPKSVEQIDVEIQKLQTKLMADGFTMQEIAELSDDKVNDKDSTILDVKPIKSDIGKLCR